MARDTSKLVTIPGELHSAATGNIVAATQEIFDYDSSSYQSQLNKQVYNVSAHDSSAIAKYSLDEAIAAVPTSYHVGGLILTFVSNEGDFEMYRLKSTEWTDDTDKWGIIKTAIMKDNPEFIEVHLDGSDKVLYGVHKDGDFYFGGGVPSQIKSYVDGKSTETDRKIEEEISALDASTKADIARLDSSVSSGFARIDASILELGYYKDNPEYVEAHIDASSRLLYGVQKDGNFYFGGGVPRQVTEYLEDKLVDVEASIMDIDTRFYNVNAHDVSVGISYTLEEAIAAVPEAYRKGGLILTFNSDGFVQLYQCKLDSFSEDIKDWTKYTSKKYVDLSLSDIKQNVDSSISELKYKTSNIWKDSITGKEESIILATDDNIEVTKIFAENTSDESEVLEFINESSEEIYAKIGVVDNKKGIFTDGLYDLEGNPLIQIDSSNDILILAGKKYKMIPYIEEI